MYEEEPWPVVKYTYGAHGGKPPNTPDTNKDMGLLVIVYLFCEFISWCIGCVFNPGRNKCETKAKGAKGVNAASADETYTAFWLNAGEVLSAKGVNAVSGNETQERDDTLRPRHLHELIGQVAMSARLRVAVNACNKLKEPLGHILFDGPPGLGKTTFVSALLNELGKPIRTTNGSALSNPGDVLPFLTGLEEGSVFFIDEIDRMPRAVQEFISPAIKDFRIDIVLGDGLNARTISMNLKRFTLIGATTRSSMLSSSLRDSFKTREYLEFYSVDELAEIIRINANKLKTAITEAAALELARRCRGTPRVAISRLAWVRKFSVSESNGQIDLANTKAALEVAEVDLDGLDKQDRTYLDVLISNFAGGPVGVEAIAATMNLPANTLAEEIEPYLFRGQYIVRTARGRMAAKRAFQSLGRK